MAEPGIDTIYHYLAVLITEREPGERFMVHQVEPAIQYKFSSFTLAHYGLATFKDFILSGENAGYFKLINTGDMQTAYLLPGTKSVAPSIVEAPLNQPRHGRSMQQTLSAILQAERTDQLIEAISGTDALSPAFEALLNNEDKAATSYLLRGKLRRISRFLATYRDKGEAQAVSSWQPSRGITRLPSVPPIEAAIRAHVLVVALTQGHLLLKDIAIESLNNMFFAVLIFCHQQLIRERAWDWAAGLEILEAEAHAVPRPLPPQKRSIFSGKQTVDELDDTEIGAWVERLRKEKGIHDSQIDDVPIWKAFVETSGADGAIRFLEERPTLLSDERLLSWLDNEIGQNVAAGAMDMVRKLAHRSAIIIGGRQIGLTRLRQQPAELQQLYDTVMDSAQLLGKMFVYLDTDSAEQARYYLSQHEELLSDEVVGPLLGEQLIKTAQTADQARYRRLSDRVNLWRKVLALGLDEGWHQYERTDLLERSDKMLQAEMGLLLLTELPLSSPRDILERYPAVGTPEGLAMAEGLLHMLSFQGSDSTQYNRYFQAKRLIERCLEVGVDRALAELK